MKVPAFLQRMLAYVRHNRYRHAVRLFSILSHLLVPLRRKSFENGAVLHVSYMVHTAYYTTRALRSIGVRADYRNRGFAFYSEVPPQLYCPLT